MTMPPHRNRRWLLGAAVGAAGLSGGVWWAMRTRRPSALLGDPLPEGFWSQTFETLSGSPLALSALNGQPLLLNFWATWCPPCVKEMPELDRFHQTHSPLGWHTIGLAIDGPTPVRQFLAARPIGFPIGLAGFGGTELAKALGNTSGGLPFSVMIDSNGRIRQRKIGPTTLEELRAWAAALA